MFISNSRLDIPFSSTILFEMSVVLKELGTVLDK